MKSVQSRQSRASRLVVALLLTTILATSAPELVLPNSARAGTLVVNGMPPFGANCGLFIVRGSVNQFGHSCGSVWDWGWILQDPGQGSVSNQSRIMWQTNAPAGIAINSATIPCGQLYVAGLNDGGPWGGGSYWAGGGEPWSDRTSCASDGGFSSSYYGFQIVCERSACSGTGLVQANAITLTATENQGPSLAALGGNNLWYQSGRWVHNANGDGGFPIALASSGASGVCDMWAYVNNHLIQGPAAAPNAAVWHQCPDQTWTQGAVVNTRDYITGAGPLSLELDAVNAAGVDSRVSETLADSGDRRTT